MSLYIHTCGKTNENIIYTRFHQQCIIETLSLKSVYNIQYTSQHTMLVVLLVCSSGRLSAEVSSIPVVAAAWSGCFVGGGHCLAQWRINEI